jgi:hypothetical protein
VILDSESRRRLTELARNGSAAHRLARRANALVLLDKGISYQLIAEVLVLDGNPDLVPTLSGRRDRRSGELRP